MVLVTKKKNKKKLNTKNKQTNHQKQNKKKEKWKIISNRKQTNKKATGSMHTHEPVSSTRMYKAMTCIVYYLQQKQKQDSYVQFLDIYLEIDINGYLSIRLYDKGDHLKDWSLSYVALELAV